MLLLKRLFEEEYDLNTDNIYDNSEFKNNQNLLFKVNKKIEEYQSLLNDDNISIKTENNNKLINEERKRNNIVTSENETLNNKLNKILEYEKRLKNIISTVKTAKSKFPDIKALSKDTDSINKTSQNKHSDKLPLISERYYSNHFGSEKSFKTNNRSNNPLLIHKK